VRRHRAHRRRQPRWRGRRRWRGRDRGRVGLRQRCRNLGDRLRDGPSLAGRAVGCACRGRSRFRYGSGCGWRHRELSGQCRAWRIGVSRHCARTGLRQPWLHGRRECRRSGLRVPRRSCRLDHAGHGERLAVLSLGRHRRQVSFGGRRAGQGRRLRLRRRVLRNGNGRFSLPLRVHPNPVRALGQTRRWRILGYRFCVWWRLAKRGRVCSGSRCLRRNRGVGLRHNGPRRSLADECTECRVLRARHALPGQRRRGGERKDRDSGWQGRGEHVALVPAKPAPVTDRTASPGVAVVAGCTRHIEPGTNCRARRVMPPMIMLATRQSRLSAVWVWRIRTWHVACCALEPAIQESAPCPFSVP
jgi:hypothetical protein